MNMGNRQKVLVLALWCVLVVHLFEFAHASNSTTTAPSSTTETPRSTATPSTTPDCSTSASADGPETSTEIVAVASLASSADTGYICSGDGVARLTKLNEKNLNLQAKCTTSSGLSSYVFPFNGELSYAQMVAMSAVGECGYYFRAVLLVQLQECVDANVYIRTTAETILQLAATSGKAPTEAEVNAAIEVRKTYNLALRDGDGVASYSTTSGAPALSWNIEGNTIDTTASANTTGQLLLSTDLHIIGTYYTSSDSSASTTSNVQNLQTPGHSTEISEAGRKGKSPCLVALTFACITLLLHPI